MKKTPEETRALLDSLSRELDFQDSNIAIILAAGHGKRIKSETPKMLHEIWGVPTVLRVSNAARRGLDSSNQVIVVGIKAGEVASSCGRAANRTFVYQQDQKGTGHAVRIALDKVDTSAFTGTVYVFPGDVGLLNGDVVAAFRQAFEKEAPDMMVLTSLYQGEASGNYYGRILRVPETDAEGRPSGADTGKVIEIMEHKDILSLSPDAPYVTMFNGKKYAFTRDELIELREFNTGVYAFKAAPLTSKIGELNPDNIQGELYVTDLIAIFNRHGLDVRAFPTTDDDAVLGFNVKSVLKQMEAIARNAAYEKLKDTITIVDKEDFYIAEDVIDAILEMDRSEGPLDIFVGKGAYIGPSVTLSKRVRIEDKARITGSVVLAEDVQVGEGVRLSTFPNQRVEVGARTHLLNGATLKGDLILGEACRIESAVNVTGSDEHPTRIGNHVRIKGQCYIYGCRIEDDIEIEYCVLKNKHVERTMRKDGAIQPVRWVIPQPQGLDTIRDLNSNDYEDMRS